MIKYARSKYFINRITKILLPKKNPCCVCELPLSALFSYHADWKAGKIKSQMLFSAPAMVASCWWVNLRRNKTACVKRLLRSVSPSAEPSLHDREREIWLFDCAINKMSAPNWETPSCVLADTIQLFVISRVMFGSDWMSMRASYRTFSSSTSCSISRSTSVVRKQRLFSSLWWV